MNTLKLIFICSPAQLRLIWRRLGKVCVLARVENKVLLKLKFTFPLPAVCLGDVGQSDLLKQYFYF